jgi:oleate hydratase
MTRPDRSVLRRREFPALELPLSFTVLDEFRIVNDADKNWSKARPLEKQGQIADSSTMGLNKFQQLELVRLLLARKEDLDDVTVEDWFSDLLIATITLLASIFVFGNRQWPKLRYLPVAGSTITIGLC